MRKNMHQSALRLLACGLGAGLYFHAVGELEASRQTDPCDSEALAEGVPRMERKGRFETLRDVSLSEKVEDKLGAIASAYGKRTGKTFVVTSGTRVPESQAELLYDKLNRGEDLTKLYKDKAAIGELVKVFDQAKSEKKRREVGVSMLGEAIRAQMKRGIYISAHLRAGAADVRSHSMDAEERKAFLDAAREAGGVSLLVEDSPPHFHLQMD